MPSSGDWGASRPVPGRNIAIRWRDLPRDRSLRDCGRWNFALHEYNFWLYSISLFECHGWLRRGNCLELEQSCSGATGGGYGALFGTPQWRYGPGFSGGARGVPDVSWDADPQTGVIVSVSNGPSAGFHYFIVGGTSVGSPRWAGSFALIDQKAGAKLRTNHSCSLLDLNNPAEYSKTFHDVTVGNNNPDSAGVGWDPLTGIGSPNLGELANSLLRQDRSVSRCKTSCRDR